jgi:hypothetical protein
MITGAVKTTPIAALQQYAGNISIVEEIKNQSANTFVTIKSSRRSNMDRNSPK